MTHGKTKCTPGVGLALLASACSGGPAASPLESVPPPIPSVRVDAPWRVVDQSDDVIRLQLGESPRGVVIRLTPGATTIPGLSLVEAGRELPGDGWPLTSVAFPERPLQEVRVESQGLDLVFRVEGPPLSDVSPDPLADDRPIVTQVRVRPRPSDWRVVVDGLTTWALPAPVQMVTTTESGWRIASETGTGALELADSSWQQSALTDDLWFLSTHGALRDRQPYPRSALTWTPQKPSGR